jgi:hypothetical protein
VECCLVVADSVAILPVFPSDFLFLADTSGLFNLEGQWFNALEVLMVGTSYCASLLTESRVHNKAAMSLVVQINGAGVFYLILINEGL